MVIAGPTGAGKSDLSLHIASLLDGEIVNFDSLQIYRHFDLGTAKVPIGARRGIPHHLIDFLDPNQVFTAGDYARCAREILAGISARQRIPVLVGGTGFYLSALLDGLFAGPGRDENLRRRLLEREHRRPGGLHRLLRRFDPDTASRVHPRDLHKTIRALEITLLSRQPASVMFQRGRNRLAGYQAIKIGLNPVREELYRRLNLRTQAMFDSGLVEEVRQILALGFPRESKPFGSLGYRHSLRVLSGEITIPEAVLLTQRDTRRYAKRQLTWFRKDKEFNWFDGFGDDHQLQVSVAALLAALLAALQA